MKLKKIFNLVLVLAGFSMMFYSLSQGTITGAVVGVNSTSKYLGIFGLILMILAVVLERYEEKIK